MQAHLRKDFAESELEDLKHHKITTTQQCKQRVAQILHSYISRVLVLRKVGERHACKVAQMQRKTNMDHVASKCVKSLCYRRNFQECSAPVQSLTAFCFNLFKSLVPFVRSAPNIDDIQ